MCVTQRGNTASWLAPIHPLSTHTNMNPDWSYSSAAADQDWSILVKYVCTHLIWLTPIAGLGYSVCQEAGQDLLVSTWIYHMNIWATESCSPTLVAGTLLSSCYKHTYTIRSLQQLLPTTSISNSQLSDCCSLQKLAGSKVLPVVNSQTCHLSSIQFHLHTQWVECYLTIAFNKIGGRILVTMCRAQSGRHPGKHKFTFNHSLLSTFLSIFPHIFSQSTMIFLSLSLPLVIPINMPS